MANQEEIVGHIVAYIRKNQLMIILCLVVMLMCMVSLYKMQGFTNNCNDHWTGIINSRCTCSVEGLGIPEFNETFSVLDWGGWEESK